MTMSMRGLLWILTFAGLAAVVSVASQPLARQRLELPQGLPTPIAAGSPLTKVDPSLWLAEGPVTVLVRLTDPPLSVVVGKGAKQQGAALSPRAQRTHLRRLLRRQTPVVQAVRDAGGSVTGRLGKAINGVVAAVEPGALPRLARLSIVSSIRPIADYERHLTGTVSSMGVPPVWLEGIDGTGVRVAVLDSGIDYTHANLGGPGTIEAYLAAYGSVADDPAHTRRGGLFPTAKVVEGFDFVGELWPEGPLQFDDDPIDFEGHGTHVADIIAGVNGVAPGAKLFAYKVCSAVSSACSGIGILFGLEAAVDPNGDGDVSDAVDIVNLSLGIPYGRIQDDTAAAVQNLVDMGIVVVCSAGNSGDQPYVVGSPATAPGALAVAQTHTPGARAYQLGLQEGAAPIRYLLNTASVAWAPVLGEVTGAVVVVEDPDGSVPLGAACDPLPSGSLAGKVALIDRGACAVSRKVDHAARAGAVAVILANYVPGNPPAFSFGGGDFLVPTLVITQADGEAIKAAINAGSTVTAFFSDQRFTSLAGSMVASSSRGPAPSSQAIKPDLGAPGALVSARVGTGTGTMVFGGTSGAAPMVAGAAALVIEAHPALAPYEVKARLMNNADPNILLNPTTLPGVHAPITLIGAGEMRVDRAVAATNLAYDRQTLAPSLSFGYVPVHGAVVVDTYHRWVEVRNLGADARTYTPAGLFRYADDADSGALEVGFQPATLTVAPGGQGAFRVSLAVDSARLPYWEDYVDGGVRGGSGEGLRKLEYDGYVTISCSSGEVLSLPWHILPRAAADVRPADRVLVLDGPEATGTLRLTNRHGSRPGVTEVFDLLGTSPISYPVPPPPGASYELVDLKSFGARAFSLAGVDYVEFAVATHGEPAHPNYPAGILIAIDTDGDGLHDYEVYHQEDIGFGISGQNITVVYDVAHETETVPFYTDSDLNSAVWVFTVPLALLGMEDWGEPMEIVVFGYDNYFTGAITDILADGPYWILYTPGIPRFFVDGPTLGLRVTIPQHGTRSLPVGYLPEGDLWSPSQTGFQLFHRQAAPKRWTDEVQVVLPP